MAEESRYGSRVIKKHFNKFLAIAVEDGNNFAENVVFVVTLLLKVMSK